MGTGREPGQGKSPYPMWGLSSTLEESLKEVDSTWALAEPVTIYSRRPVIGPVLTFVRWLIYRSSRWYVEGVLEQQRRQNLAVTRSLHSLAEEMLPLRSLLQAATPSKESQQPGNGDRQETRDQKSINPEFAEEGPLHFRNDHPKTQIKAKQMRIIWTPTQWCPLYSLRTCRYCGYLDSSATEFRYMNLPSYAIEKQLTPEQWVEMLSKLPPALLDATGGEPLAYGDMTQIVRRSPQHDFAFTTNLMYDPELLCGLENVVSWTCSYHYLAPENAKERFWVNWEKLMGAQANCVVTVVAYPDEWGKFREAVEEVRGKGINLNIHPYYAPNYSFPSDLWEELKTLEAHIPEGMDRWHPETENRLCSAGTKYIALGPDGTRYRCYTHQHLNIPQTDDNPTCNTPCLFPCDWHIPKKIILKDTLDSADRAHEAELKERIS